MKLEDLNQHQLDKFCYLLSERDKANKLRHKYYARYARARRKLIVTTNKYLDYGLSPKLNKFLIYEADSKYKHNLVNEIENNYNNYKKLNKFLKDRRKLLTHSRKKLCLKIRWCGANRAQQVRIHWKYQDDLLYSHSDALSHGDILKRANDYVTEKFLIDGNKRIMNPYSLKKVKFD